MSEWNEKLSRLNNWRIVDNHHLFKNYQFIDFKSALSFVNQVGLIAEKQNHHPNISFTWGKVEISIWSHDNDGLTVRDFDLAERIDQLKV